MASTNKGKARKHQEEPCTFLSNLNILQSRANYCVHVIKATERGNPLKRDFLAYIKPATDKSPEKKLPVCLYWGVWHSLKYTNTNDKPIYLSEPIPEIHDYDVEVPTRNSESEPERDPLDTAIRNSPAILKEPLTPETPIAPTPFFTITKNDLSQILTMTTTTQTATQVTCYDTTGSSDVKSLGGALAILGDDTKSFRLSVCLGLMRSVRQLWGL